MGADSFNHHIGKSQDKVYMLLNQDTVDSPPVGDGLTVLRNWSKLAMSWEGSALLKQLSARQWRIAAHVA